MIAFLDTSALVKLYHKEEDSNTIQDALANDIETIYLSGIANLEFRSALWKKVRLEEISSTTAIEVIEGFEEDSELYSWITVDSPLFQKAVKLLMKYGSQGLRTLDSIQLASALTLSECDCLHITSDALLKSFLEIENLRTL